jgi:hypothetical protein
VGEFNNSVQKLQQQEGGFDSRRGGYASIIERGIKEYLLDARIMKDITIVSDRGLERYGIDPEVFQLIYPNWSIVKVYEDSVWVGF